MNSDYAKYDEMIIHFSHCLKTCCAHNIVWSAFTTYLQGHKKKKKKKKKKKSDILVTIFVNGWSFILICFIQFKIKTLCNVQHKEFATWTCVKHKNDV